MEQGFYVVLLICIILIVRQVLQSGREAVRQGAGHEADQAAKELAEAEFRVQCARDGHPGYIRKIHLGYCPSCHNAVPPSQEECDQRQGPLSSV